MAFVKNPLNATTPREIIEYSQDLEDRTEEAFDDVGVDLTDLNDALRQKIDNDIGSVEGQILSLSPYLMEFRGSVSNLDDATETGIYRYSTTGILAVFAQDEDNMSQIIVHWNSVYLFARTKWNGTWSTIKRVALTEF